LRLLGRESEKRTNSHLRWSFEWYILSSWRGMVMVSRKSGNKSVYVWLGDSVFWMLFWFSGTVMLGWVTGFVCFSYFCSVLRLFFLVWLRFCVGYVLVWFSRGSCFEFCYFDSNTRYILCWVWRIVINIFGC
jgi:hypothetical protein